MALRGSSRIRLLQGSRWIVMLALGLVVAISIAIPNVINNQNDATQTLETEAAVTITAATITAQPEATHLAARMMPRIEYNIPIIPRVYVRPQQQQQLQLQPQQHPQQVVLAQRREQQLPPVRHVQPPHQLRRLQPPAHQQVPNQLRPLEPHHVLPQLEPQLQLRLQQPL
ncbi:unnamed protein product, partial [Rotaria socialis]